MVRQEGLEPTPCKGLEPKSSASTSFATGAQAGDYTKLFRLAGVIALFFQLDPCCQQASCSRVFAANQGIADSPQEVLVVISLCQLMQVLIDLFA